MNNPPNDVPAFAFWLMPDEDPAYADWPSASPLRSWQRGRCAMCQVTDWFDNHLVMDHDHATGLIRGLLCRGCNTSEPHNDSEAFRAWRAGFTPADVLGIAQPYAHKTGGAAALERLSRMRVGDEELDRIAEAMV